MFEFHAKSAAYAGLQFNEYLILFIITLKLQILACLV